MKKILFGLAVITTVLFTACSKESTSGSTSATNATPVDNSEMSTKVVTKAGTKDYKLTSLKGSVIKDTKLNHKVLTINGVAGNRRIGLSITETFNGSCFDLKEYDYMGFNNQAFFTYDSIMETKDTATGYVPISGKIEITECNLSLKILSGKYDFKLYNPIYKDTVTITDGVFKSFSYTVTLQ